MAAFAALILIYCDRLSANKLRRLSNQPLEWTGLHQLPVCVIDFLPATQGQRCTDRPDHGIVNSNY